MTRLYAIQQKVGLLGIINTMRKDPCLLSPISNISLGSSVIVVQIKVYVLSLQLNKLYLSVKLFTVITLNIHCKNFHMGAFYMGIVPTFKHFLIIKVSVSKTISCRSGYRVWVKDRTIKTLYRIMPLLFMSLNPSSKINMSATHQKLGFI